MRALIASFGEPTGQGWEQVGYLALAFVLSSLIGLEREIRQRSAGLRTHALVGVASALIMLVSKYGFTDVLSQRVILDPSRVAAQIVSGIGFIGGGLIFVRRDAVRGLTTAATIWLTAGVGMAAGAGLPILACLVTGAHFLVVYGFTPLVPRLERLSGTIDRSVLRITYRDQAGILHQVMSRCTGRGYTVAELTTEQVPDHEQALGLVSVTMRISGPNDVPALVADLSEIAGVLGVRIQEPEEGD
ncbi:MAG TPA: MgtC/SapB family protein [Gaiella sp.]|jgi:putative Mg2+ transporter-C (MgtC) family protein